MAVASLASRHLPVSVGTARLSTHTPRRCVSAARGRTMVVAAVGVALAPRRQSAPSDSAFSLVPSGRPGPPPPRAATVVEALDAALGDSAARDAGAALGAAVAAYLWVKLFDVLASKDVLERKLSRKVIHTTSGPFFMLTWPLFGSAPSSQLFAALVPALQAVRLFAIGSGAVANENAVRAVSREGDKRELLGGPFIYTLVLLLVTACFWRTSPAGIAALSLMCGGDGLADIVGRRLGKGNALPWNGDKSFAGSVAMFLGGFGCSLFYVWLFHACGYVEVDASGACARLALIAAVCTAAESAPVTGLLDDNISVPVLALALGAALFS
jgi:dolichol kinase